MNHRPVPLNLRKSVTLPQAVIIPLSMHSQLGVERRLLIQSRVQPVPLALRQWLQNDRRYAGWFDEEVEPVAEPMQAELTPPGGGEGGQTPPGDETGAAQDPGPTPTADQWYEGMTVPVLRDYAKRYNVELTTEDLKADVVDKLRAARGDFEWKPSEPETPTP